MGSRIPCAFGVGAVTLVDLDDICITNTNRQLPAMSGLYGKMKIHAMRDRILAINPQCQVHAIEDFFTEKSASAILDNQFDYVIDAIDSLQNKALLVASCKERSLPILITGGCAGKIDPTLIRVSDLGLSENDSLLFRLRKNYVVNLVFQVPLKQLHKRSKDLALLVCTHLKNKSTRQQMVGPVRSLMPRRT